MTSTYHPGVKIVPKDGRIFHDFLEFSPEKVLQIVAKPFGQLIQYDTIVAIFSDFVDTVGWFGKPGR